MRGIFIPVAGLLLSLASMGRARVDPQQAQKACDAVRSGQLSLRAAAKAFGLNKDALSRRLSGAMAMDARVGPETVLSKAEEDAVYINSPANMQSIQTKTHSWKHVTYGASP